jgi:hypothetical protein
VIKNAVIHINNEQPLLADLYGMPTPADVSLVCTNIRMLDGKKPVFIDHQNSVFVFPYLAIRFVEVMAGTVPGMSDQPVEPTEVAAGNGVHDDGADLDLELDEDFLRRVRDA